SATSRWPPCRSPRTAGTATGTTPCTPGRPAPRAAPPHRRPRPPRAWPGPALDALPAHLTAPAAALREAQLTRRRGDRPRQHDDTGRQPRLTLTARLTAAILHDRHGLPYKTLATLFHARHEDLCRHSTAIRRVLHQTGHTIPPAARTLTTLDDRYAYATAHGINPQHTPTQRVNN